jgi:hypothetical protein
MRRLFRTALKWAPILYPIVKKVLASRGSKVSYPKR